MSPIKKTRAIGTILPSSNRIVERATLAVLAEIPDVDACFTRIPYFGASNGQPVDGYHLASFLDAADLLAHAKVDVICWNGTRGAGLGFTPDRDLCDQISQRTGLPALTTALATLDLLTSQRLTRIAVLNQGSPAESDRLTQQFNRHGIEVVAIRSLEVRDNYAASDIAPAELAHLTRSVVEEATPDAVLIWSTNFAGYSIAADLQAKLGVSVLDSATVGAKASLHVITDSLSLVDG